RINLTHAWSAQASSSVSVSQGSRAGGWSAYTDHASLAGFAPERARQLEIQSAIRSQEQRLSLEAHLFAYHIRDLQIERSFNAQDYLVVNAPKARSRGEEIELRWHPSEAWHIVAAIGANQATLTQFEDPFTRVSYAGHAVPYVPAFTSEFSVRNLLPS